MLNACIICHKKKIKCNLARQHPCANCTKADFECVPYQRKRKRYTNSLSPRGSRVEPSPRAIVTPRRERCAPDGLPDGTARGSRQVATTETVQTYRGRDRYLGRHTSFNEAMITPATAGPKISDADRQMLQQQGAFDLPPPAVQDKFISIFTNFGLVWTPIVDPAWLSGDAPSYLLLQAIFLAASRMAQEPIECGTSTADFYRRAKLLFFFGSERDPLISIVSAIILHWYNPVGPETISTDTSGFWLRTAEAIAYQIGLHKEPAPTDKQRGLRRRVWWTLVLRDCIISAGVGRPRTINLRDSDVLPPSFNDFSTRDMNARIFLVYVPICQLLGDIVESCLRRELQLAQQTILENALFRWAKQDFPTITSRTEVYTFEARQIIAIYFASLIILDRSPTPDGTLSARSLLASSFIAGVFREFLEQDEICRLGPVFTFYALCAGLVLVPAFRFRQLQSVVHEELIILKAALQVLSKQWGSAFGALRALQKLSADVDSQPPLSNHVPALSSDTAPFFEGFNSHLCRVWSLILDSGLEDPTGSIRLSHDEAMMTVVPVQPDTSNEPSTGLDMLVGDWEGLGFDWSGSWLLDSSLS